MHYRHDEGLSKYIRDSIQLAAESLADSKTANQPNRDMGYMRSDASLGVIAEQLAIETLTQLYRFKYPSTKYADGSLLSIDTSVDEGASVYAYTELEDLGHADLVAENATDLPNVDIAGHNNLREIRTVASSITFTTQDLRASQRRGVVNIAQEKARSARRAMDRILNQLIRTGRPSANLRGFTNHPGIKLLAAPVGNWLTAAPATIRDEFATAVNAPGIDSDAVLEVNTVSMSRAIWGRLHSLQNGPGDTGYTVMRYLVENNPQITKWESEFGHRSIGPGGTDAMMLYNRDSDIAKAILPMPMRPLPVEERGLNSVMGFEMRYGGVIAPQPKGILKLSGI